jgi:hypothetical protein
MSTQAIPQIDTGYFFEQIAKSRRSTLVLDFDTTLGLATLPRSAFRIPAIGELLECIIMAGSTRVVLATARSARDVLSVLGPPYPEIWAGEGREQTPMMARNTSVSVRIHASKAERLGLIDRLCATGPLAYLVAERGSGAASGRILVRPALYLSQHEASLSVEEDLMQFLIDWLRACAGETC